MRYPALPLLLTLCNCLVNPMTSQADDVRQWSNPSGSFKMEAQLISADKDLIVVEQEDGGLFAVRQQQLSEADQQFVKQFRHVHLVEGDNWSKKLRATGWYQMGVPLKRTQRSST